MPDVFLTIAATIVKTGMQIWLRNDSAADDASSSVIDLLKTRISGELQQRQAARFFEDLEIPVVERLRALRQSEFRSMPDNECTAATLAASYSFARARLTPGDLLSRDLDPLLLERHIRSGGGSVTRDLSDDGTAYYGRLISEGCAYAIEIADKLPNFSVGAFAELLRRDRQILETISTVLDRIPPASDEEPAAARFVTAYLRHLATKLDRLELFGLDFESYWYPLSLAYISLQTDWLNETGERRIEDALSSAKRLVVLGRAGSGKTTVLQWIAVRAARSDFADPLAALNGHTPFLIRLRGYVGSDLPAPENFISSVAPMLAGEMPAGWVQARLRTGKALVLIDGVDELPPAERDSVLPWIRDLIDLFPAARYVITSRSTGVPRGWLQELDFTSVSLQPMPPATITAFVEHWHEATRRRLEDEAERLRVSAYERSLLATIRDDRHLRDLADTPLLAGLLCALNHRLRSNLPRRRSEIYSRALYMFDQRDRVRNIPTGDIDLDLAAKTRLLSDLALRMIRNGESEVATNTAVEGMDRSLYALPGISHDSESVFRILLERSGVLREPATGRVDFVHRTFQEYLAAWGAVDDDLIGELARNANDDQWAEVLVMAAGQTNRQQTTRLFQGLLKRSTDDSLTRQRHLVAVSCLPEVQSLDTTLQERIEANIPDLLPPASMSEAEQLSKIGRRLIPLLAEHWDRDISCVAETIRAASLIGGPEALDLIEAVVRYSVRRTTTNLDRLKFEAERACQYFDATEYSRRVTSWL